MSETQKKPDYEQELRRAGVRITRPRRIILDILSATEDHPDALEIFRRAVERDSGISLSTVYRTMNLLEERASTKSTGRARKATAAKPHGKPGSR